MEILRFSLCRLISDELKMPGARFEIPFRIKSWLSPNDSLWGIKIGELKIPDARVIPCFLAIKGEGTR